MACRRTVVRAAFRELPRAGGERPARTGAVLEMQLAPLFVAHEGRWRADGEARYAGLHRRHAIGLHERRTVVRAAFRELPRSEQDVLRRHAAVLEMQLAPLSVGTPSAFMSDEQWCELHFENCRVPAENVLLGPGGFKKQMGSFNVERLGNSARSLAFGRYAYNTAREHALTREQFGRPLCEFQG